jgi:hypothetical protein
LCQLAETFTLEKVKQMLQETVAPCFKHAEEQEKLMMVTLQGFATIPLSSISVPSHSRYLCHALLHM